MGKDQERPREQEEASSRTAADANSPLRINLNTATISVECNTQEPLYEYSTKQEDSSHNKNEATAAPKEVSYASLECMDSFLSLKEMDLKPNSFSSLPEAFRASLCVIRCLRCAVGILRRRCVTSEHQQHSSNNSLQQEPKNDEHLSSAAEFISQQEAFIADESAYAKLLKGGYTLHEAKFDDAQNNTNDQASCSSVPPAAAAGGAAVPEKQRNAAAGMEYELSVCKALLLLQQLTPNNTNDPSPSVASSALKTLFVNSEQNKCSPSYNTPSLQYTDSSYVSDFMQLSATSSALPLNIILDVLLRVRLLQGTQQLLRADVARLLQLQRKQQQQLQQAVLASVNKLGKPGALFFYCLLWLCRKKKCALCGLSTKQKAAVRFTLCV